MKHTKSLGEVFYQLSNIHSIRWVASETIALEKILKNYNALVHNMAVISELDNEFGKENAEKALTFQKILLNNGFLTTLVFSIDVLHILQEISLEFQKSSFFIGKENLD